MANRVVEQGPDTRAQGVRALRWVMPMPGEDEEARVVRKLLRRIDVKAALLAELDAKTREGGANGSD